MNSASRRAIPAVEKVLQALGDTGLPRPLVVTEVRRALAELRARAEVPPFDEILAALRHRLTALRGARLRPVINGTGILIHTNLGRAPMGAAVVERLATIARYYNTVEFDLDTGERGSRGAYVEAALAALTQAPAATVVNNCAAALVLILGHLACGERNEVLISRGELVQIGGGFRIPEILAASGARLREVGTTNRTTLDDYSEAFTDRTALILKVHRSNFFMEGFVESPDRAKLANLAHEQGIPFVEDLGSGAMIDTTTFGEMEHEPTPAEVLAAGADLVCFSGDKLLGGPQAGLIIGRADLVGRLKKEPFFRALRCDKLILTALEAVVDAYMHDSTDAGHLPLLHLARLPQPDLQSRAEQIIAALANAPVRARVGSGESQLGGGTMPRARIPSVTVDLKPNAITLETFAGRLREQALPLVGYISSERFKIDLRTVFPEQDQAVITAVRGALNPVAK